MKTFSNTKLNEKQIYQLLTTGKVTRGAEGVICKGANPYTLYKIFVNTNTPVAMGENKEKKILELYKKQIQYSIKPIGTVSFNDVIIGYEMIDEYSFDNYQLYQLDKQELIYFLKETKKILEYYNANNIVYGDIDPKNILFNKDTGEIKFCDMDNIQINQYKIDKLPYTLNYYCEARGIDDGVHPYAHNQMSLNAFDCDCFCSSKKELKKTFSKEGLKTIKSMRNPLNFKNDYLITRIKKI